jgi:hypothetical protein
MFFSKKFWGVLAAVLLVLIVSGLQHQHLFAIAGIRPNLALVALTVLAFFIEDLAVYTLLVVLACIGIRFQPGISPEIAVFALVAMLAFFIKQRAVWPGISGTAILLLLGTLTIYAFIAPSFLFGSFAIVLSEAVYNIVLGLVLFEAIALCVKKTRLTI